MCSRCRRCRSVITLAGGPGRSPAASRIGVWQAAARDGRRRHRGMGMTSQGTDADGPTGEELATALAVPIGDLGGRFMLSGRTYGTGAGLGFSGLDFYFCGRAGVLGPVDADVVV